MADKFSPSNPFADPKAKAPSFPQSEKPLMPALSNLTDEELKAIEADAEWGGAGAKASDKEIRPVRLSLEDLSPELELELSARVHEIHGKASGYLPDFHAQTDNMKNACRAVVREVWLAAQRKVRTYHE